MSLGYQHIGIAYMYLNEHVIGRVLKRWLDAGKIKREELSVVTKVASNHELQLNTFSATHVDKFDRTL